MGSDSDMDQVGACVEILKKFGVQMTVRVLSAHRTPSRLHKFVHDADAQTKLYICAAGGAAHLAGVVASLTLRPVIGIPILMSQLGGADSLYSMVQMPGGVSVATVGIGKSGAKNAGLLAVQILALSDEKLAAALAAYREEMAMEVEEKDQKLQKRLMKEGLS